MKVGSHAGRRTGDRDDGEHEHVLRACDADLLQLQTIHVRRVVGPEEMRIEQHEGDIHPLQRLQPVEGLLRGIEEGEIVQVLEPEQAARKRDQLLLLDVDLAVGFGEHSHDLPQEVKKFRPIHDAGRRRKGRFVGELQ